MGFKIILVIFVTIQPVTLYAHGDDHESSETGSTKKVEKKDQFLIKKYEKINEEYKKNVYSILKKSCFDCHSPKTHYPWYYSLPYVKTIIDKDISKGRSHIEFTKFPFKSHDTPKNDLIALKKSLNRMPPRNYLIMHPSKILSENEKNQILSWIDYSMKIILE